MSWPKWWDVINQNMWGSINGGYPNSWIITENHLKMDDLVPPRLRKPPFGGNMGLVQVLGIWSANMVSTLGFQQVFLEPIWRARPSKPHLLGYLVTCLIPMALGFYGLWDFFISDGEISSDSSLQRCTGWILCWAGEINILVGTRICDGRTALIISPCLMLISSMTKSSCLMFRIFPCVMVKFPVQPLNHGIWWILSLLWIISDQLISPNCFFMAWRKPPRFHNQPTMIWVSNPHSFDHYSQFNPVFLMLVKSSCFLVIYPNLCWDLLTMFSSCLPTFAIFKFSWMPDWTPVLPEGLQMFSCATSCQSLHHPRAPRNCPWYDPWDVQFWGSPTNLRAGGGGRKVV